MIKRLVYSLIFLLLLVTALIISAYYYLQSFAEQPIHLTESNQVFTLKKGTSLAQLAKQVEQEQLLDNAYLLPYLIKLKANYGSIKAGTYALHENMTVDTFLQQLTSGREIQLAIQFVEGKKAQDWLAVLASSPNIEHKLTAMSLEEIGSELGIEGSVEGWLSPDTYHYSINSSDLAIFKRAYQKMQSNLQAAWDGRDKELPYKSPYEMLIMASIIEKETGVNDERTKVASVFINRLKINMRLQTDPTIIYGMGDNYKGNIGRKDLQDTSNSYNTYVISGLPPTPIAMPSISSLHAAAHPDNTNYIYFVADGKGGHVFSTNYKNHQKAVNEYWRLMRSRNN